MDDARESPTRRASGTSRAESAERSGARRGIRRRSSCVSEIDGSRRAVVDAAVIFIQSRKAFAESVWRVPLVEGERIESNRTSRRRWRRWRRCVERR